MKHEIVTRVALTLVLDKDEADWLHTAMQNPLNGAHPADEHIADAAMRHRFFEATKTPN